MLIQKDFNRFENYVSQPETYKTLFEPRSLWDKMSFHRTMINHQLLNIIVLWLFLSPQTSMAK